MEHTTKARSEAGKGAVCVAVYRPRLDLLRVQLNSIATQSLSDFTCHVVIDGEDSATFAEITELVGDDERFIVHHFSQNVGFYRNFERAVELVDSSSRWIALADQDDCWYPTKLEVLVHRMLETDACAVSGQARVTTAPDGRTHRRDTRLPAILFDNQFTGSFCVFRRDVIDLALPFPEPLDSSYHDHWLGVCATALGKTVFVDEVLQDYVQHGNNVLGERAAPLRSRFRHLGQGRRHNNGVLRYLSEHRWGWRVRMSRELLERLSDGECPQLRASARGRLSIRLSGQLTRAVLTRRIPAGRGAALLLGSVGWTLYRPDRLRSDADDWTVHRPDGRPVTTAVRIRC